MLRFSANLSMLYTDLPFIDRFAAAANDGFKGVEFLGPYGIDKNQLIEELDRNKLTQVLFNLPSGDWDAGERGIACLPDRVDEFLAGIPLALEYAEALGCKTLNVLAGKVPQNADRELVEHTFISNLKIAAEYCAKKDVQLIFEPINSRDIPGFFVNSTNHAELILKAVDHSNLRIQYDLYHMQIMQGDLVPTFERLQAKIGHVQIADTPGRHEPGTGEINYRFIFEALDRLEYEGWVGCEYVPKVGTTLGLSWMKDLL